MKEELIKKVSIIGGDSRIVNVANMLSANMKVYTFGIENAEELLENTEIIKCSDVKEAIEQSDVILTSIPLTKDGENILTPFSNNKIRITEVFNDIAENKLLITGKAPKKNYSKFKVVDLLERDDFAIYNAIATAEGAIASIILNTKITLYNSKILILGFGRIAKVLANRLKNMNAKIYCTARKSSDFAWIETLGYEYITYNNLNTCLNDFDIIINTIPVCILKEEEIKLINNGCFILDLASAPGGIDANLCKKYNKKLELYLGIPGKVAPISSAEIIIKTMNNVLLENN